MSLLLLIVETFPLLAMIGLTHLILITFEFKCISLLPTNKKKTEKKYINEMVRKSCAPHISIKLVNVSHKPVFLSLMYSCIILHLTYTEKIQFLSCIK